MEDKLANRVIERCSSTNDLARRLGEEGCPHGTWVSARIQESGRGRLGRRWESLGGNLFLSLVLRVEKTSLWSWLPLATAVGASRALLSLFPDLNIRIKWPNDLWLGQAKCGGILCEGIASGNSRGFVVAGLGLNCARSPSECKMPMAYPVTSLSEFLSRPVSADEVREPLRAGILETISGLQREGLLKIRSFYEKHALLGVGSFVRWEGGSGQVVGLGEAGELLVQDDEGRRRSLLAEDVSLAAKAVCGSQP